MFLGNLFTIKRLINSMIFFKIKCFDFQPTAKDKLIVIAGNSLELSLEKLLERKIYSSLARILLQVMVLSRAQIAVSLKNSVKENM